MKMWNVAPGLVTAAGAVPVLASRAVSSTEQRRPRGSRSRVHPLAHESTELRLGKLVPIRWVREPRIHEHAEALVLKGTLTPRMLTSQEHRADGARLVGIRLQLPQASL